MAVSLARRRWCAKTYFPISSRHLTYFPISSRHLGLTPASNRALDIAMAVTAPQLRQQ